MIQSMPFAESVKQAFLPTPRGVVGLVDDLLGLCRAHQLHLRFADGHCSVRRLGADDANSLAVPLPKSVFRAALARVAALCNEQRPGSVTPYRGEGEVVVPAPRSPEGTPPSTCFVSFTNTPAEQQLEMRFSRSSVGDGNRFTVLLRDRRTVTVYGHALKHVQNDSNAADGGSYGILARADGGEVLVALFRVSEVVGVFAGELLELGATGHDANAAQARREAQRQRALDDPTQGL